MKKKVVEEVKQISIWLARIYDGKDANSELIFPPPISISFSRPLFLSLPSSHPRHFQLSHQAALIQRASPRPPPPPTTGQCTLPPLFPSTSYKLRLRLWIHQFKLNFLPLNNHHHIYNNLNMSGKGSGLTKPMKLSADLADIVGKKEASRAECVKQLWAYLKKNNLQDPENKQFFTPDKKMAKVTIFGSYFLFTLTL